MSENQEYPEAWGVFMTSCYRTQFHESRGCAEYAATEIPDSTVVKLIPAPTVERLVREAAEQWRAKYQSLFEGVQAMQRESLTCPVMIRPNQLADAIGDAVATERERCRSLCDDAACHPWDFGIACHIEEKIRSGNASELTDVPRDDEEILKTLGEEQHEAVARQIAAAEQRGQDAERERCRRIARDVEALFRPEYIDRKDDTELLVTSRVIANRIAERIESGEQPGEGGE